MYSLTTSILIKATYPFCKTYTSNRRGLIFFQPGRHSYRMGRIKGAGGGRPRKGSKNKANRAVATPMRWNKLTKVVVVVVTTITYLYSQITSIQHTNVQPGRIIYASPSVLDCPQEPCHLSIVFMGDSLTRFMYYSLVYFLRHNMWIDPFSKPNLVKPADILGGYELHFDWMPWYNFSNRALDPYEKCDCYREKGSVTRGMGRKSLCENRYFHDPTRNNTIVYFQAMGNHIPVRGHFENPPFFQQNRQPHNQSNFTIFQKKEPFSWSYEWPDAILHQVSKIRPSPKLILAAAAWLHDFDKPDFVTKIIHAVNKTVGMENVLWKTATANRRGQIRDKGKTDRYMCEQLQGCLNVSGWTSKLSKDYYIDEGHFREPVYRKMNEELFLYLNLTIANSLAWAELGLSGDEFDN